MYWSKKSDLMSQNIGEIVEEIDTYLVTEDGLREGALKRCRGIIRASASVIMACHRNEGIDELNTSLEHIKQELNIIAQELADHPHLYHSGFVENAQTEAVEAAVLIALIQYAEGEDRGMVIRHSQGTPRHPGTREVGTRDVVIPTPDELHVRETAYLKGLGDVIGELRRFTLEALRNGDQSRAECYYDHMESIYSALRGLKYSHVSSDLRRKMDTARVLLERTLGELVNIGHMSRLEHLLDPAPGDEG